MSRHIANLEEDIGVRFFLRTRNSVELTETREKFYDFFKETVSRYNSLQIEIMAESSTQMKNIYIGYQNWMDLGPALGSALAVLRE
ncbi:MAG: hypothetical protein LBT08_09165, partial [Synergistaceae bacterium]|nr:hypothetical protein [Synergistaceae bacterium]